MAERQNWLDWVKATAITLVVYWHLHPLPADSSPLGRAVHLFEFEASLTAVPTFLIASLYLFFPKADASPREGARRLFRLATIYLFWTAVQIAVAAAATRAVPQPSLQWIYMGGPGLPLVYDSIFYYLFDLLLLTALGLGYARLPEPARAILGGAIVLLSLARFQAASLLGWPMAYLRPDNFLLYVPIAFALSRAPERFVRGRWLLGAAWLSCAAEDVYLERARHLDLYGSVYGRCTVAFGALALIGFAAAWRPSAARLPSLLAKYSLGIYAVHKYWQYLFLALHQTAAVTLLGTLAGTAATVFVLSRTPLRRFVA